MADDLIKVDIAATYDDKAAKAAKQDLEAIDGATAEATVDADVGPGLAAADADLDAIDGRTVEATVDADVGPGLADADADLDAIDGRTVEATVDADVGPGLADADADLDAIDGRTVEATVDADVGAGLTGAESDLDAIDGATYKATVDADKGVGLTGAESDLDAIDGATYKATVDADAGTGLGRVKGLLADMAGAAGGVAGNFGALAGPAGLVAGVAGFLFNAATDAANLALEAQKLANFTGASVEDAGRLQTVLGQTTDIEAGDLMDIIAQMSGVLAENPALIRQFGMSMDEVRRDPLGAFVAIVDKLGADGKLSFDEMITASQLFGEEGVRQVNDIISAVGPDGLQGAMDDVAETQVITADDVAAAQELRENTREMSAAFAQLKQDLGTDILPLLADAAGITALIARNLMPEDEGTLFGGIAPAEEDFRGLSETATDVGEQIRADLDATDQSMNTFGESVDDVVASETETVDVVAELTKELQAQAEAHRETADAAKEQSEAFMAANDVYYAEQKAIRDVRAALDNYNEVVEDSESTLDDQVDALQATAQAADDLAASEVAVKRAQREAEGATLSATEALDIHNDSLLDQVANLQGPTRDALIAHIARLNGIPKEALTDIIALIDEGKVYEAEQELQNVSRARDATVIADTEDAAYNRSDAELEHLARDRVAKIYADYIFRQQSGAGPGPGAGGRSAPTIVPVGVAAGDTYNLNVPRGTRPDDMIRALDRHARRNGRRPYAFR